MSALGQLDRSVFRWWEETWWEHQEETAVLRRALLSPLKRFKVLRDTEEPQEQVHFTPESKRSLSITYFPQ